MIDESEILDRTIAAAARVEAATGKSFDVTNFRIAWKQVTGEDPIGWTTIEIAENLERFATAVETVSQVN